MLINDDECDTEYPEALEDERLFAEDLLNPLPPTFLLATIHVVRLLSPLSRLFRSLCITNEILAKFENHLGDCLQLFPKVLHIAAPDPLEPRMLGPIICFQNTRLMLHRHNLSPSCSPEQRLQAIDQCFNAARDTTDLISRCTFQGMTAADLDQRFALVASTFFCTHLWRCMLFLLFRHQFDAFFLQLRILSSIGVHKAVNISCGRYLAFFIRRLIEHYDKSNTKIEHEEELLVYVSGDLQASTNSWAWGNAETGTLLSRRQKHGKPRHTQGTELGQSPSDAISSTWANSLEPEEQQDWGGWDLVGKSARHLQQLVTNLRDPGGSNPPGLQLPQITAQGASPLSTTSRSAVPPSAPSADSSRSRMKITNII